MICDVSHMDEEHHEDADHNRMLDGHLPTNSTMTDEHHEDEHHEDMEGEM